MGTYLYCKAVVDGDLLDQKYLPNRLDSRTFVDLVLDPAMVANNPKLIFALSVLISYKNISINDCKILNDLIWI